VAMQCAYHPDREPVGACVACGKLICADCKAVLGGKYYCTPCADKIFVKKESDTSAALAIAAETAPKSATETKQKPATETAAKEATPATSESGQSKASVLPDELKGWNWGAFFLNWIWGLGNSTWIALLCLIPMVDIVMIFVLGAKGNEWAWQNKKWKNIEHFKKTQRTWKRWGVALFVIWLVLMVLGTAAYFALIFTGSNVNFSLTP
jgi:hypothetical protein